MPETIIVSVLSIVLVAVTSAVFAAAPVLGPRGRFFGVIVDPEFVSGPFARRIVRVYRTIVLGVGAAAVAVLLLAPFGIVPMPLVAPVALLSTVGLFVAYIWAHGRTLTEAKKTPVARTASDDARHWMLGIIYFNPSDPRIDVPTNFGYGSTLNMARGTSWFILSLPLFFAGLIALILALVT